LKKIYFKVKLVEDFENKYEYYLIRQGYSPDVVKTSSVGSTVRKWLSKEYLELYQYPIEVIPEYPLLTEDLGDYFEKEDDEWAIPRHLFEVL